MACYGDVVRSWQNQSKTLILARFPDPRRRGQHVSSKRQDKLTHWHSATSQKTWIATYNSLLRYGVCFKPTASLCISLQYALYRTMCPKQHIKKQNLNFMSRTDWFIRWEILRKFVRLHLHVKQILSTSPQLSLSLSSILHSPALLLSLIHSYFFLRVPMQTRAAFATGLHRFI